jgi:AhpD family alkylhydroperoxidase
VTDTPRISPGSRRDIGVLASVIARVSGRVSGTGPPNLFLTLGRHRALFRGWLRFAGRLMPGGRLPRRETELVILRVAHLRRCSYEFDHHVHLGRRAGVMATDVDRVVAGPSAEGWAEREQAILEVVDQMHHHGDVGDAAWKRLAAHLDEREILELLLLAGHYEMLATTITTLRIQPDAPRSGRVRA